MEINRNYGIDLLRLVLMFMVCVLHTLGQGGILNACEAGTLNSNVYWFFEILCMCAVDAFVLISGYMISDKPHRYDKLAALWFQAFFYSFILSVVLTLLGLNPDWKFSDFLGSLFPVLTNYFWFFTAFFALFLVMPVLKKYILSVDKITARKGFIIAFTFFSLLATFTDPFRTTFGYSAMWLIILYCLGGLARRGEILQSRSSLFLILIWAGCILLSLLSLVIYHVSYLYKYISPTMVMTALIMVILFSRLPIRRPLFTGAISKLSPLAFGIYLFQTNHVLWDKHLYNALAFAADMNILTGVLTMLGSAVLIFLSGLAVEFIRSVLFRLLHVSRLSQKIVGRIDKLISR